MDSEQRLVIGWTCDDCDEAIGDGASSRMWDLAERLRKEHEEETGHTTTVEVVEEKRILPSQGDRMDIGERMLDLAEKRGDRIDWICPECHRSGEELETTKRCPDCDERLREVLPDGGPECGVDDIRLKSTEDGPLLQINDEISVLLRTLVEVDDETHFESHSPQFRTDVDSNGDNGAWWNIWPGDEVYPLVSIHPEVVRDE